MPLMISSNDSFCISTSSILNILVNSCNAFCVPIFSVFTLTIIWSLVVFISSIPLGYFGYSSKILSGVITIFLFLI